MKKRFTIPPYLSASVLLIGTSIGAGIFSVPYAVLAIGAVPAIGFFVVLGAAQLVQHIAFAEATIAAKGKFEFTGLARKFLGGSGEKVAAVIWFGDLWATQLAYILAGGLFLHSLVGPFIGGGVFWYQFSWSLIASLLFFWELNAVAKIAELATVIMVVSVFFIAGFAFPHIELANYAAVAPHFDAALAFGVILFAFSGYQGIGRMHDAVGGDAKQLRSAIIIGTLATIFIIALFSYVIFGLSGAATTADIVTGLHGTSFSGILSLALAFIGFMAVLTSFLTIGGTIRQSFQKDFRVHRGLAWLMSASIPFGFFLVGLKRFERVIEFSGAIFEGITALLIVLVYLIVAKKGVATSMRRLLVVAAAGSFAVVLIGCSLEIWKLVQPLF